MTNIEEFTIVSSYEWQKSYENVEELCRHA